MKASNTKHIPSTPSEVIASLVTSLQHEKMRKRTVGECPAMNSIATAIAETSVLLRYDETMAASDMLVDAYRALLLGDRDFAVGKLRLAHRELSDMAVRKQSVNAA
jgi:hypothetical protein